MRRELAALRSELVEMQEADQEARAQYLRGGRLADAYHPELEAIHVRNGQRLGEIIDRHGWPGPSLVGEDGAAAAWMILQHAISMPELQRRGLEFLRGAYERGDASAMEVAMLEDRICVLEGRGQMYGTQFDWDSRGELSPEPIEDPGSVDDRRRAIGLMPLADTVRRHRRDAACYGERPPRDREAKEARKQAWLHRVGWRRTPPGSGQAGP